MSSPERTCRLYREMRPDALGPPLGESTPPKRICWCEHDQSPVDEAQARSATVLLSCEGRLSCCELPPDADREQVSALQDSR